MKRVIVRYKVKPEHAADNERLVAAVYAQLARERPAGLRYATLKLDDGVSFVHIAIVDTADGKNPVGALSAFQAFTADIATRCEVAPVTGTWTEVGAYRLFDGDS